MRAAFSFFGCALLLLVSWSESTEAQDRRGHATPGIVLETGAMLGNCDVLTFSPDGKELLAVGDEKVVRVWKVEDTKLSDKSDRVLRWPIYREQRGAIYAMALSPNDGGKRVAIGGHGLINGLIWVIDRATGNLLHAMDRPISTGVTTYLIWSPDGKYTIHGTELGEVFRWEPASNSSSPQPFAGERKPGNRIRGLAFLKDGKQFLAATREGKVFLYHGDRLKEAPRLLHHFDMQIYRAELSPDHRWLAVLLSAPAGADPRHHQVQLFDLQQLLRETTQAKPIALNLPRAAGQPRFPTALAFSDDTSLLAVGTQQLHLPSDQVKYRPVVAGQVFVWSLKDSPPRRSNLVLKVGYNTDSLAFRPRTQQLAVAGGPNHEVRLFNLAAGPQPLSTRRSPGSAIWRVAFSDNGKYLLWSEQMKAEPSGPNDRGIESWRTFVLKTDKQRPHHTILSRRPSDATPILPREQLDGWSVHPTGNSFRWEVHGPGNLKVPLDETRHLYYPSINQVPQCYTFLEGKDGKLPRLAIGHMWGVSLYELDAKNRQQPVRLVRSMLGHQGEVICIGASQSGELLVTGSRDQTIACWSLSDWPTSPELGAKFVVQKGRVTVAGVDPGSPAWEAGLTPGDQLDFFSVREGPTAQHSWLYNPAGLAKKVDNTDVYKGELNQEGLKQLWQSRVSKLLSARETIDYLHQAKPGREHVFAWRDKDNQPKVELTTLRQRPLWVFYPTRAAQGNHWLIWRWRDFYYDSDLQNTDRLAGLQRSYGVKRKPTFYSLSQMAGPLGIARGQDELRYYDPQKVWPFVTDALQRNVEIRRVLFADVEPPEVKLEILQQPNALGTGAIQDLKVRVTVTPHHPQVGGALAQIPNAQRITRLTLWRDDYLFDAGEKLPPPDATGRITHTYTIGADRLQVGENRLRICCFNAAGGRAEASQGVFFRDPKRGKPKLLALCIGVGTYPEFSPFGSLRCSPNDADRIAEVFREHQNSKLFDDVVVRILKNSDATRANIEQQLQQLSQLASPGDWLVFFFSGHGGGKLIPDTDAIEPGTFFFGTYDADPKRANTLLSSEYLANRLTQFECNKIFIIDACHSGDQVPDIVRSFNRDGAEFLMFVAAKHTQPAAELKPAGIQQAIDEEKNPQRKERLKQLDLNHGLFTKGLLNALDPPQRFDKKTGRQHPVSALTIRDTIEANIRNTLQLLQIEGLQTPVFSPDDPSKLRQLKIFCAVEPKP